MTNANDTIRVLIPLKVRKKNGRPKILPPADYLPSEDQTQDPHVLRAIGRAWGWLSGMSVGNYGWHTLRRKCSSGLPAGARRRRLDCMICVFWLGRLGGNNRKKSLHEGHLDKKS